MRSDGVLNEEVSSDTEEEELSKEMVDRWLEKDDDKKNYGKKYFQNGFNVNTESCIDMMDHVLELSAHLNIRREILRMFSMHLSEEKLQLRL